MPQCEEKQADCRAVQRLPFPHIPSKMKWRWIFEYGGASDRCGDAAAQVGGSHFFAQLEALAAKRPRPTCEQCVFISWSISLPDQRQFHSWAAGGWMVKPLNQAAFLNITEVSEDLCLLYVLVQNSSFYAQEGTLCFYELHRLSLWLRMRWTINFYSTEIIAACF